MDECVYLQSYLPIHSYLCLYLLTNEGIMVSTYQFLQICALMPLSDFYLVVQIAPYDQLQMIERLVDVPQPTPAQT